MSFLIGLGDFFNWGWLSLQGLEALVHIVEALSCKPSPRVADVDESVAIKVPEQQCADVLATISWLRVTADNELFPELDLELDPRPRPFSRLVARIYALGHDALPSLPASLLEHLPAISLDGLGHAQVCRRSLADTL